MVVTATVFLVSWTWTADKTTKDASFCDTGSLLEVDVVTWQNHAKNKSFLNHDDEEEGGRRRIWLTDFSYFHGSKGPTSGFNIGVQLDDVVWDADRFIDERNNQHTDK